MHIQTVRLIFSFFGLACLPASYPALAKDAASVLIVATSDARLYAQAIEGFKDEFANRRGIVFSEFFLNKTDNPTPELSTMFAQQNPALILALGGAEIKGIANVSKKVPVVATMILKRSELSGRPNLTGVYLFYPLTTQFNWLKRLLPNRTNIAILYNPLENQHYIESAIDTAVDSGLAIIPIPVKTPKQLPYALGRLSGNVNALFAIPDSLVLSPKTAQQLLLASFRNLVPMVGFSENWVKAGALYALTWDYQDLGRQCAVQAANLLNGADIASIPPEPPRKLSYSINSKIAQHMKINIPDHLLLKAKHQYP